MKIWKEIFDKGCKSISIPWSFSHGHISVYLNGILTTDYELLSPPCLYFENGLLEQTEIIVKDNLINQKILSILTTYNMSELTVYLTSNDSYERKFAEIRVKQLQDQEIRIKQIVKQELERLK